MARTKNKRKRKPKKRRIPRDDHGRTYGLTEKGIKEAERSLLEHPELNKKRFLALPWWW